MGTQDTQNQPTTTDTKPQTGSADKPFYQRWWEQSGNTPVDGSLGSVTDATAKALHGENGEFIHENYVKQAMPWAAGAVAGLGALTLADPITKGAQTLTDGLSSMLRKIPIIGSPLAWVSDRIGDVSGFVVSGVAAIVAFKAFKPKAANYEDYFPEGTNPDTPNSGTGATPQPSLTKEMGVQRPEDKAPDAKENVPIAPAPVPNPVIEPHKMSQAEQDAALKMNYAELRTKRSQAIEGDHKHLQEAYRSLMQAENQRFENRVQFVKDARAFEAAPRQHMVQSLYQHAGLSKEEAEALIVKAPQLRATIYPGTTDTKDHKGGNGISADGNIPQGLVDFAHKFEEQYGKGFVWVASTNSPSWSSETRIDGAEKDSKGLPKKMGISFDEMSTTQKVEYIEKAIQFTKARYEYVEHHCAVSYDRSAMAPNPMGGGGFANMVKEYDYTDRPAYRRTSAGPFGALIDVFSKAPVELGAQFPNGWKSLKDEHKYLQGLNGDIVDAPTRRYWGSSFSGPEQGDGLKALDAGFGGFQQLLDSYKEALKQAETSHNGEIKVYKDRVQMMEQSLGMLKKSGVVLLDVKQDKSQSVLTVRDVRAFDPTKQNHADTRAIKLYGGQQGSQLAVREVEIDGKKIPLGNFYIVSLETGAGMDAMLKAMDEKRASFALASQQGGHVKLPSQEVDGTPDAQTGLPRNVQPAPDKTKLAQGNSPQQ